MKKRIIGIAILAMVVMSLFGGILVQPVAGFTPTKVSITPDPVLIPCNGGPVIVTVEVTGTITNADQQAQKFDLRLVDGDTFRDDIMGETTITPAPNDPWVKGQVRTFTVEFELRCVGQTVWGLESSGETEADLAVEIDNGRLTRKTNHFGNAQENDYVPARCVPGDEIGLYIMEPKDGYLYLFSKPIVLIGKTVIFGSVTTEVEVHFVYAERVEFYVDRELVHTDYEAPYEWLWDQRLSFIHTLGVCAYTECGNNACDEIEVLIFNL